MNRILRFAVATLIALPMFAADLGKFSKWSESPQSYFMTKAERQQWNALATEADAEKFVSEFLAKREPGFAAEVAKRAEQADKYLTIADRAGSKTLRGKVVVLFGPPSGLNISNRAKTTTKRDNPLMAAALSNAGSVGSSGSDGDSTTPAGGSISTSQGIRVYSITFSGDATTKTIDKQSVTFIIEADAATGKDEFASRSARKEAEEYFELAARESIVRK